MVAIKNKINLFKKRFDLSFSNYLEKKYNSSHKLFSSYLSVQKNYYLKGGKRLRPFISSFFYKSFSGKSLSPKYFIPLELFHQFILVHDDIIDNDKKRYGGDNLWASYQKAGERFDKKTASHFGLSLSLIAGDLAFNQVFNSIANLNVDEVKKLQLTNLFNQAFTKTTKGWYLQYLDSKSSIKSSTQKKFIYYNLLVTSYYSFYLPIKYAAILSGSDITDNKILHIANSLGLAYQIKDDYLGIFGNQNKTGKPIGSDFQEGKKTLFIIKAYQLASKKDKNYIVDNLSKKQTQSSFRNLNNIIKCTGSLSYCQNYQQQLLTDATKNLLKLKLNKKKQSEINELIDYLFHRNS